MTEKQLWLGAPDAPLCLVTGRPMQRGKNGWICGVACQPGWDENKVGAPYVHGKCWHAVRDKEKSDAR